MLGCRAQSPAAQMCGSDVRQYSSTRMPLSQSSPASRASAPWARRRWRRARNRRAPRCRRPVAPPRRAGAAPMPHRFRHPSAPTPDQPHAAPHLARHAGRARPRRTSTPPARHHAVHHAVGGFEHGHLEAGLAAGGRDLEADVSAADDDRAPSGRELGAQPVHVGDAAQVVHAGELGTRQRQQARMTAGGQQQPVVFDARCRRRSRRGAARGRCAPPRTRAADPRRGRRSARRAG